MGYYLQFDHFDPLTGQPPDQPITALPAITSRARALLTGRSRDQIISAANTADWLINEFIAKSQSEMIDRILETGDWVLGYLPYEARTEAGVRDLLENWPSEADDLPPDYPTADNVDDIYALRETINGYALADDPDFPNGNDYEYFAVLALWKISDAIKCLKYDRTSAIDEAVRLLATPIEIKGLGVVYAGQDESKVRESLTNMMKTLDGLTSEFYDYKYHFNLAVTNALDALEAVCYAEHLKEMGELRAERDIYLEQVHQLSDPEHQIKLAEKHADAIVKKRISDANTKAAIKRHTENHAMKKDVFDWCSKHLVDFPSMDAAAEAIAGKLVYAKFRTVRNWISEYRKQLQSARRL